MHQKLEIGCLDATVMLQADWTASSCTKEKRVTMFQVELKTQLMDEVDATLVVRMLQSCCRLTGLPPPVWKKNT